jgi:hypothetical protein
VQFKDHGWHESRLWFVMPWYKGETLDARISRGPLSRREARDIFEPLARALATMHESGIRHQDVKPDNIFLAELPGFATAGGVLPVLLDLGVAAKEAEMVVAGTPTYFAPEVAAQFAAVPKPHPIGSKADVFSLALSLKNSLEPDSQDEVAAGAVETFIDHRAKEPPEPPLDADLRFLRPHFEKWMAMDPGERPTAQELASQLAILTAPEDRRARLISLAKWLGPLLATLAVTFAAVVFIMDREARLQELEAEQARLEAAETRDSLVEEEGRRRALEVDVRHARDEYERSELTRGDLANRLAETEGDLTATRGGLREERARTRGLRDRLGTAEGENVRLTGELVATRDTLDRTERTLLASERHAADLSTQLDTTRTELGAARADAERERRRVAELTTEAGTLRSQLAGSRAEAADLQRQIATAEQARSQAAADLAAAQRRIADLERQLAAARNRPATTPPITSMVREESEPDVPAPAPGPTVRTGADP